MVSPSSCLGKRGIASSSRTTTGRRGSNQVASTAQVTKPTAAAAPKRCRNRRRVNSGGVKFAVYHFLITSYLAMGLRRHVRADAWRQANIKVGVERELTRRESEPSELIYFKVYKSQVPVIDPANRYGGSHARIGQVAGVLSGDDLRGFPGGAHLEGGNPKILLLSMMRLFRRLPATLRRDF